MADNKDKVTGGNNGNSPEQEQKRKDPNKDYDPERQVESDKQNPSEKNPDDFE
ncbi:hypothetical protein [Sediminibacillus massiliensis]|uniref:hypothetical protein n=1 Tax=Sediminibacillus massiliensis TaxID=1926277 RepID=UPI0015C2DBD6|nr:hypothetical protein [Sediminibacillus massiliensis]